MFEDTDNEFEYTNKSRAERSQDSEKFRARSNKVTHVNRGPKKGGTPGSVRLRRNKRWSW